MAGNHQLSTTDLPPAFLIERNVKCVTELVSYEFFSLFLLFPSLFKDFSVFFLSYSVQSRRPIVCLCRTTLIYVLHFWRHVLLWSFVSATFSSTTADSEMKYRTSFSMFYSIIQILEEILCVRSNRRLMKFLKFESDLINCLAVLLVLQYIWDLDLSKVSIVVKMYRSNQLTFNFFFFLNLFFFFLIDTWNHYVLLISLIDI